MSEIEQKKLEENTRIWLKQQCLKAAKRISCQFRLDNNSDRLAPEMVHFFNDTYNIVATEMELLLATHEAWKKAEDSHKDLPPSEWNSKPTSVAKKRPNSVESKDLNLAIRRRSVFQLNEKDKKMHIDPEIPPHILNCSASDILGDSICAIISLDYDSMLTVCERLSGKLLPKTLREFIWTDKLLKADIKVDKSERIIILETEARVKFGRTVEHRIAELKIRRATRSPISGLIENAVVELNIPMNWLCTYISYIKTYSHHG
ncbi:uncharacterized protein [Emydura macquarii macquarii]|uniref:uncharacterized protein n=1 Tax=Emydura macquarii macquarii TaxID=1129001 RepID=UPI00352A8F6A